MSQLGQSIDRIDDVARLISKIIEVIIDMISANTMKNSVIITIVILDIVFGMVGIADTCQTMVVVGIDIIFPSSAMLADLISTLPSG